MAKHPHRLLLVNHKTWRCTLPNCPFFVHTGLSYILIGKQSVCWECSENFTVEEESLKDEQPICEECRAIRSGGLTRAQLGTVAEVKETLAKANVKDENELTPMQRTMLEMLGKLPEKK